MAELGDKVALVTGGSRGMGAAIAGRLPAQEVALVEDLEHVLRSVDTTPASEISSLTPWAWARQQNATARD